MPTPDQSPKLFGTANRCFGLMSDSNIGHERNWRPMNFTNSLGARSTDDFERHFLGDLNRNLFHLDCIDRVCTNGGRPETVDSVTIHERRDDGQALMIKATLYFTEFIPSSCGAQRYPQAAIVEFKIDQRDGTASAVMLDNVYSTE